MAGNAIVIRALLEADLGGKIATAIGVAFQASLLVISNLLRRLGKLVRIVTGDAAQLLVAPDVTATLSHLFDMPFRLTRLVRLDRSAVMDTNFSRDKPGR